MSWLVFWPMSAGVLSPSPPHPALAMDTNSEMASIPLRTIESFFIRNSNV